MNPLKCCGCIVLSNLLMLVIFLGILVALILILRYYLINWGRGAIAKALQLPNDVDLSSLDAATLASNNCSGCVFGADLTWPTTTSGVLHFLDTDTGTTVSTAVAGLLASTIALSGGWAFWLSLLPSIVVTTSPINGFYEMLHIVEQAQHVGMISQLQIKGAPRFLHEFSKQLAWTNFNVPNIRKESILNGRLLSDSDDSAFIFSQLSGPERYGALIKVKPNDLFTYSAITFIVVVAVIHGLYLIWIALQYLFRKNSESLHQIASHWYRKVIWSTFLLLLLTQYIFSMSASYYLSHAESYKKSMHIIVAIIGFGAFIGFTLLFGVCIVLMNTEELRDVGTPEHEQRPFGMKYGAYYNEYNFPNRFFFTARILLAVSSGVIVGAINSASLQLYLIISVTMVYLMLLVWREPNLLPFVYYVGAISIALKLVLFSLMLALTDTNKIPQTTRSVISYIIIGINGMVFMLLFMRQCYLLFRGAALMLQQAKSAKDGTDSSAEMQNLTASSGQNMSRMEDFGTPSHAQNESNSYFRAYAEAVEHQERSHLAPQNAVPHARSNPTPQLPTSPPDAHRARSVTQRYVPHQAHLYRDKHVQPVTRKKSIDIDELNERSIQLL